MTILNYANQLNASRQGALGGILQNAGNLQGLRFNEENMQSQRDADSAVQQQEQNKVALSKEAQEVYSRNDPNEIAEFSIANPIHGANMLAQRGIVDAAGKQRVSDRFANILTSADPLAALQQEITQGETAGLDMSQSKEMLDQGLSAKGIKQAAGMALASIDGARFQDIQKAFIGGGVDGTNFAPEISPVQTDPETGQKYVISTNKNTGETNRVDVSGAIGESIPQEEQRLIRRQLLKDASVVSKDSFKSLNTINKSLLTMDEAIKAIDAGAETGVIDQYLPSFTQATLELENIANRMGLDVVSATTFGALSEGELRLAMNTALPQSLQPKDLRKWIVDRKDAKKLLAKELKKMAIQLGKGKMTIAEYLEKNATFTVSDDDLLKKYGG